MADEFKGLPWIIAVTGVGFLVFVFGIPLVEHLMGAWDKWLGKVLGN